MKNRNGVPNVFWKRLGRPLGAKRRKGAIQKDNFWRPLFATSRKNTFTKHQEIDVENVSTHDVEILQKMIVQLVPKSIEKTMWF